MTSYELGYPEGAASRLQILVDAVCPSHGVSIGRWNDRATWRHDAKELATEEERDAARAVMATFDPWGDGSDIGALAEDEDPGDLGGEMLAAQDEAGEGLAHVSDVSQTEQDVGHNDGVDAIGVGDAGDSSAEMEGASAPAAYPGVALLPDELGARRNAVLAAIAKAKLTHLAIAMDPSLADFLAARFAEYNNAGALGLPIDDALAADYRAFQEIRDRRDRITNYAMQLEQSALDGDMDRLAAMHAGLSDGWP